MRRRIGIIGGGAAGFFAAIQAATTHSEAEVTLLEGSNKPLAKVLISGGGRCNVTNHTLDNQRLVENYPRGAKELRGPFSQFSVKDTISWFQERGVELKTEPDNRMFPVTDSSETIANCLHDTACEAGVAISLGSKVQTIARTTDSVFVLTLSNNSELFFDSIVLATGGSKSSFALAEGLGHTIVSPVPSLFTFEIRDALLADFSGLSFPHSTLTLEVGEKKFVRTGPLLITHWGLSGPATIQLSALAARELFESKYFATLRVSFSSPLNSRSLMEIFTRAKLAHGKKLVAPSPLVDVPKRFWSRTVELAQIRADQRLADCSKRELQALANLLTAHPLQVRGKGVFKEEFVTCGGVLLKEVSFKTMESKRIPKLFFAGEVLDIDGITGGFNFQSAWTTGWVAGLHC